MTPETCQPSNISGTEAAQAVNVALDWTDYAEQQPLNPGPYEWQVPSATVNGMTVRVLAHFRQRGAGYENVLSSDFDHWDGYNVRVPAGTKWRPAPEGTELKQYEQKLICVEGLDFVPCPYCNRKPRLNGVCRASDGGVVITGDAHRYNSWWLECCAWAHTPRYSDPRELEKVRSAVLTSATSPALPQDVALLVRELNDRAAWRTLNEGPFTKENLVESRAASLILSQSSTIASAREVIEPQRDIDRLTAALVALTQHNIPTDVQDLLVSGDASRGIAPGALEAALPPKVASPNRVTNSDRFYGDPVAKFRAMAEAAYPSEAIDGVHFRMWCVIAANEIETARAKRSAQ